MRSAAARVQCRNNIKQLGLALTEYADAHGQLPCGTFDQPSLPPDERLSWLVALLPYVEQQNLFSQFDPDSGWDAEPNRFPSSQSVRSFICPSEPKHEKVLAWSFTSYVGITGIGADAVSLPLENRRAGVFGYERRVTKRDVKDGTSVTMWCMETADTGRWAAGGQGTIRPLDRGRQPYIGEGRPFGVFHSRPFFGSFTFSRLPTVAHIGMLDGSVRMLETTTNPQTLEALATIAGQEEIGSEF